MCVSVRVCRHAVVSVQCVLLWYNDQDQSTVCCVSSQHRLRTATVRHVLADRRLGLEHYVGHGLRTARLSVNFNNFSTVLTTDKF